MLYFVLASLAQLIETTHNICNQQKNVIFNIDFVANVAIGLFLL